MNRSRYLLRRAAVTVWVLYLLLFCAFKVSAQKYAFAHYNIEDGLIQSQVNRIYQDNTHRLWMATLGGACRFDGHDYYGISKANGGLINNFVYTVYADSKGIVWLGTNKGLSSFKNQKIYNYPIPPNAKKTWVMHITEDHDGTIWTVMNNQLYKAVNNKLQHIKLADSIDYPISSITTDKAGKLYVSFLKKGIYSFSNNKWTLYAPFKGMVQSVYVLKIQFDRFDSKKLFLLAYKGLFISKDGIITPYQNTTLNSGAGPFLSFEQDAENNLWLGTPNGAYYINKQKTIHFTEANGLTDNSISDIYCDKDHNVWLGSQGSGLFRYEGEDHIIFDQSQGMKVNQVVMGIAKDKNNNILLGTDGSGLIKYNNGVLSALPMPKLNINATSIQSLYTTKDNNVWIGSDHGGIWKYDGVNFTIIKGTESRAINAITADNNGTIWLGTPLGCYYYEKDSMNYVQGVSSFTSAIISCGKDSMLIGTQEGVRLAVNKKIDPKFKLTALSTSSILCMMKYKDKVLFGTDDGGLFIWDKQSGSMQNYNVKDGLKANSIYSLVTDDKGVIWIGTGRGVNRIIIKPGSMDYTIEQAGNSRDMIVETNQNAAFYDDGKVFFGTTKGIIIFNTNINPSTAQIPQILIQGVKLFLQDNKGILSVVNKDPSADLKLSPTQNHIAISFQGVYLKNPSEVTYQYKLTGLDDKFCWPVKNNTVDYPSLPPGKYVFEVKAVSPEGKISANTAKFNFEIIPPFYQTPTFRILGVLFLVLLGFGIQYFVHQYQINKQKALETLKREEKQKLRQQTAEDFHDDLGNKLTRITVLSDVLHTKLDDDKPDQKKLVEQIQQNAAALYNGTKDILWALDPKSDNLYETLTHIKETGIELFQDMNIKFCFEDITDSFNQVKLPMEYSRNITMIFKELLTNVLKHADAHNVCIAINQTDKNEFAIKLTDDGKGYDGDKANRGHGIVNINARAKRIGAKFTIKGNKEGGTTAGLKVVLNIKTVK